MVGQAGGAPLTNLKEADKRTKPSQDLSRRKAAMR